MAISRTPLAAASTAPTVSTDRVTVDVSRLKPLFQEPTPPLDLGSAVLPGTPGDVSPHLDDLVAKLYAKRLIAGVRDTANTATDMALHGSAQLLLDGYVRLPRAELLALSRRPEITSWVWQARTETEQGALTAETAAHLLRYAGTFLAPALLRNGLLPDGRPVLVAATGPDELTLLPFGRKVLLPKDSGTELEIVVQGSQVLVTGAGPGARVTVAELLGDTSASRSVGPLQRAAEGPLVLSRHSWWEEHLPPSVSGVLDLDASSLGTFADRLGAGLRVMDRLWPEAAGRLRTVVAQLMPIGSRGEHGNRPFNYSVHAFRGLIMTSSRTGYLAAQTLAHETAHNRFSSIVDLFQVADNADEVFYSPFVEDDRPLINLFHGVFAFLNDVHIAQRSASVFGPGDGPAIAPYVADLTARLKTALDTLLRHADVTAHGQQLLDAFRVGMPSSA